MERSESRYLSPSSEKNVSDKPRGNIFVISQYGVSLDITGAEPGPASDMWVSSQRVPLVEKRTMFVLGSTIPHQKTRECMVQLLAADTNVEIIYAMLSNTVQMIHSPKYILNIFSF